MNLMGKLKTHKATSKRLVLKKSGLRKRKSGLGHFNSRESNRTRMAKRRDVVFDPALAKTAKRGMPYA
jgi:ribosomal protein L35